MCDPGRRGKKRDLRRGMSMRGFSPHRYFDQIHGQRSRFHPIVRSTCDCESWSECRNREVEFVRKWTGCGFWDVWGHDTPPAHFRRGLNTIQRAKEKMALREAIRDWDWDDFYLPPNRANAGWLWW